MTYPTCIKTMFALLLVSFLSTGIRSQTVLGSNCADYTPSVSIPHTGNLKALIIFVKFRNDEFENSLTWDWPHIINGHADERPAWTEEMLTPSLVSADFEPSITGYFRNMSFSDFQIYGDVYPQGGSYPTVYLTEEDIENYQVLPNCTTSSRTRDISTAVWEAITNLDDEIDYSQYDNDKDGYVDELIVWFRLANIGITDCDSYNGIARLTGKYHIDFIDESGNRLNEIVTNDGVSIKYDSGVLADGPGRKAVDVMVHEIGHTMGFNHYWHAGVWNMMGAKNGVGIMNTWERDVFSWLPSGSIQTISSPGTYNVNLEDFETTGESVIIEATFGGRYVIENRSGSGYYSRMEEWVMPDNGIVVTFYPSSDPGWLTVKGADHIWNWESTSGASCSPCSNVFNATFTYPFTKLVPNNLGIPDLDMLSVCTTSGCKNHPGSGGNYGDAYKIGYNQVFSTWSNPPMQSGPASGNMCVDILSHNADSSYDLLIKYDVSSADVGTHPSKPILYRPIEVVSCEDSWGNPKITWDNNTEPDMQQTDGGGTYKLYKIYRAFSTNPAVEPTNYTHVGTYKDYSYNDTVNFIDNHYANGVRIYCGTEEEGDPNDTYYRYKIRAVDNEDLESVMSDYQAIEGHPIIPDNPNFANNNTEAPVKYSLLQNYPNPFNPVTNVKFELPQNAYVTVKVYNALGEEVAILVNNEYKSVGRYSVTFDGSNLASGIYFYSIDAGHFRDTKKMVLIK